MRFDGDVVIVTGGAGGIGRPQATELGRRGARVVVNDLGGSPRGGGSDPSMAAAVVDEIVSAGGEAVASTEDVSSATGPRRLVECCDGHLGPRRRDRAQRGDPAGRPLRECRPTPITTT